ncbi:MAG: AmmeMemoRadiSam system protein B [Bacteroidia bacterium]|nr:AmmeMemoRadiSam system protein B [Bacteroidia bacterium]
MAHLFFPQDNKSEKKPVNRLAAVAGKFYPIRAGELNEMLKNMFSAATPRLYKNVQAIISPHAGYIYSGIVAASAFNQIDQDKEYNDIFILASSHHYSFPGASIYSKGDFETPMGTVKVDTTLADKLVKENNIFNTKIEPHLSEHSIEVQLPFLQYIMKKNFRIVPILLGTQSADDCMKIAGVLKPYFTSDNLFIISTDFSHYPEYTDAVKVDKKTADAICSNSVSVFTELLDNKDFNFTKNLATKICGWTSVLTLLNITESESDIIYDPVIYRNSGDASGDRESVVGYFAIAINKSSEKTENDSTFQLADQDKIRLLKAARNTLEYYLKTESRPVIDFTGLPPVVIKHCGAFVTLTNDGELRGCIGHFEPDKPLIELVGDMAISSATQDHRFYSVSFSELNEIRIEISVLTPMKKIRSTGEIVMGTHGIYIKKGSHSGTFLPQVAKQTNWSKEEFLGHCSRDKAGIGWDGWKDAEIYIYEALVFNEDEFMKK